MKKHDEGYVMILVLVVMIVMGLVTASILTFSLRNLQNQQLSIERMADKYAAQGEIEKKLDEIENAADVVKVTDVTHAYDSNSKTLTLTIAKTHNSATVTCKIVFEEVTYDQTADAYILSTKQYKIDSYKITYSNGETEEEVTP